MTISRKVKGALLGAATVLSLTACVGPTPPEQATTLQETGGAFIPTSRAINNCVPGGTTGQYDLGGESYTYPTGERVFAFNDVAGADRGPIEVLSKDGLIVRVPGDIKFTLNADCSGPNGGVLGDFHRKIGGPKIAYMNDDGSMPQGWRDALNLYVGGPVEALMDREAQNYTARELANDPSVKAEWEQAVLEELPDLVQRGTPGENEFFLNFSGLIQKPILPGELQSVILEEQTRVSKANAALAEADAQRAASQAQIAVAQAEAQKKREAIAAFGTPEEFNRSQAIDKGLNPYHPQIVVPGVPQPQN